MVLVALLALCMSVFDVGTARALPQSAAAGNALEQPPDASEGIGRWPIQTYGPSDYGAHPQTWDVAQDERGILYVGNTDGVLIYDGETWRTVDVAGGSPAMDLARGPDGHIHVGGFGEFGYLKPDSLGRIRYVSLLDELPPSVSSIGDVLKVHATSDAVYYQTRRRIIRRYRDGTVKVWTPDALLSLSSLVRDSLYTFQKGTGLLRLTEDGLRLVPGTESFRDSLIPFVIPHPDGGLLFATYTDGLYRIDKQGVQPFETGVDTLLARAKPYHATVLPNGSIAIGTLREGLIVLTSQGKRVRTLSERNVLHTNTIVRTSVDREGGLWLNTPDGIARVDVSSPTTHFGDGEGLEASVQSFVRHRGDLFATTMQGLFRFDAQANLDNAWSRVGGLVQHCWSALPMTDALLVGCVDGVYALRGNRITNVYALGPEEAASHLVRSPFEPRRVWVGVSTGLVALEWRDGRWVEAERVEDIASRIHGVAAGANRDLWVTTYGEGVVRIRIGEDGRAAHLHRFTTRHGIPESDVAVARIDGRVAFGTSRGVMMYTGPADLSTGFDDASGQQPMFAADPAFDSFRDTHVTGLTEGTSSVWVIADGAVGWIRHSSRSGVPPDDSISQPPVSQPTSPSGRFPDTVASASGASSSGASSSGASAPTGEGVSWIPTSGPRTRGAGASNIYPEADGTAWIATSEGAVRYAPRRAASPVVPTAIVRRVLTTYPASSAEGSDVVDSLLYAGTAPPRTPELSSSLNNLTFQYALPWYSGAQTLYRYRLEGRESMWSDWTTQTTRAYANLPGGTYTFHVQAQTGARTESQVGTFTVRVLPPWYKTWWAYVLFGSAGVILIAALGHGVYRYRTYRLRRRAERLEAEIQERTEGLEREQRRLGRANRELKRSNEKRNELLGIAAHDLRNPLHSIMGASELLLEDIDEPDFEEAAQHLLPLIRTASKQMHSLVEGLLDSHVIEVGEVEFNRIETDLREVVGGVLQWNQTHAQKKDIDLHFEAPSACMAWIDETHIQRVVDNLVSNAIKFSPPGRPVHVRLHCTPDVAEVRVQDQGPGLTAEDKEHLFDKLARLSATPTAGEPTTGIGLHLSKLLMDQHGGTLHVESEPGDGATFIMRVPREKSSADPDASSSESAAGSSRS